MSRDPTVEFYHRESNAQRAEIASLRAELATERTQRENFGQALAETERRLLADYAKSEIEDLRTKLAEQTELSASALERCAELAERLAPLRAAARQDAEEKARLKELLGKLADAAEHDMKMNQGGDNHEGEPEGSGGWWSTATENAIREARAALACRPQGKNNG